MEPADPGPLALFDRATGLRDAGRYPDLLSLTETSRRHSPDEPALRRFQAQALIEMGQVTVAIDVLECLVGRLARNHPETEEALGLLGRAYKQLFLEAEDRSSPAARAALASALRLYHDGFSRSRGAATWHGINLAALVARARRDRLPLSPDLDLDLDEVVRQVVRALDRTPTDRRDAWHHATRAEAALATGDWNGAIPALQAYIADPAAGAFMIRSTLRQFTQLWMLGDEPTGQGDALIALLRARLLQIDEGALELSPGALAEAREQPMPGAALLEAVLGSDGHQSWKWWKTGLDRATAICAIRTRMGERFGTGWLVRAGDLGWTDGRVSGDECLVITNCHVVSPDGSHQGLQPDEVEVVFEAVAPDRAHAVTEVVWSSPVHRHDVSLLRLAEPASGVLPLPLARRLPCLDAGCRVYVIGHPGGRELAFSFQDNELIDHEGPPDGRPPIEQVWRVHYRAPTEGGSSGSPVFNARGWEVIALHHSGGIVGMPQLNGRPGTYAANEGIALASIRAAIAADRQAGEGKR